MQVFCRTTCTCSTVFLERLTSTCRSHERGRLQASSPRGCPATSSRDWFAKSKALPPKWLYHRFRFTKSEGRRIPRGGCLGIESVLQGVTEVTLSEQNAVPLIVLSTTRDP